MLWLTLLRRLWPYIAALLLCIAIVIWYRTQISEAEGRGYEKARGEFVAELEAERESWRQHQAEVNEEIDRAYQTQISKLTADASRERRGRAIRCVLDSPGEVRSGEDTGEPAGSAADQSALRSAENLRPQLVSAGQQCERLRQQLIAIKMRQDSL